MQWQDCGVRSVPASSCRPLGRTNLALEATAQTTAHRVLLSAKVGWMMRWNTRRRSVVPRWEPGVSEDVSRVRAEGLEPSTQGLNVKDQTKETQGIGDMLQLWAQHRLLTMKKSWGLTHSRWLSASILHFLSSTPLDMKRRAAGGPSMRNQYEMLQSSVIT